MIDLHSHILPGIDDGPKTMAESLDLARLYVEAGFTGVVATPHFIRGTPYAAEGKAVFGAVSELNGVLKASGIELDIYPGMEIALDGGLLELLDQKRILSLAENKYVLIEAPFQRLPVNWLQVLTGLRSQGYGVVLAHPERCMELGSRRELFDELIDAGIYVQANYDSFVGGYGQAICDAAFHLMSKGYIHCLATDSHDAVHRHPGNVQKAIAAIKEAGGGESVDIMTRVNPGRILEGLALEKPPEVLKKGKKKKRWFSFLGH